jgi:hypothetical protein
MKVTLEVDDVDSLTGGDRSVLESLMRDEYVRMSIGLLLSRRDPDGHTWVVFVQEVEA